MLSILVFLFIFLLIGIPLWWHTTNVYRVPLPYSEIEELASLNLSHYVPINLVLADSSVKASHLWDLLSKKTESSETLNKWNIKYSWTIREATNEEARLLLANKLLIENKGKPGSFQFYVKSFDPDVAVLDGFSDYQRSYVVTNTKDVNQLATDVLKLVTEKVVKQELLHNLYTPPETRKQGRQEKIKSLDATTTVDIIFSLVVPEPHLIDIKWNIEDAVEQYVKPFLRKLSAYIKFDIKSQIIYMSSLNVKSSFDTSTGHHVWTPTQLPHVINPIEGKLGSHISTNPTLNFVVYIPPMNQIPLHIYDEQNKYLESNAFLSPQWGGVKIVNPNTSATEYDIDLKETMEVFLAQLRLLLGIPFENNSKVQEFLCKDWENDFLIRKYTQEQISVASSTLISLGKLLGTIKNIVIKDDIGTKIYLSVTAITKSLKLLEQGYLEEAFRQSQIALINSEEAFFDPSLLALLYFPDDEKYAIYVPLFLPITIPMLLSIWPLWKLRDSYNLKSLFFN